MTRFMCSAVFLFACFAASLRAQQPARPGWRLLPIEAFAEDRDVGLLRRKDAPGAADQVRRHRGNSDAGHREPRALRERRPLAGPRGTGVARNLRSSEGSRPGASHADRARSTSKAPSRATCWKSASRKFAWRFRMR